MSSHTDDRELWRIGEFTCVIVSCCAGAELQVRQESAREGARIVLRELYPSTSDLYERARALGAEFAELETDGRT